MTFVGRCFALSDQPGHGVSCDSNGVFVGVVPLLERICASGPGGRDQWRPRPVSDLNRDLGICYGLPVEFSRKIDGLCAVARALDRGDLVHAQIATLHLQIPDPLRPGHSGRSVHEIHNLARQLGANNLLKEDWDPAKHPRTGTPPNPGWFAPTDGSAAGTSSGQATPLSNEWVRLPPAQRNDELGDLLEWIANARPEDETAIRAEIKRLYYDVGDKLGSEALNAALSNILEPGMDSKEARQATLDSIEAYANTDPARGHSGDYLTAATLLLLGITPPGAAVDVAAAAAWKLGWAARGIYFSERLGANLPANFPVIDSFVNGVVTSIKSIDLNAVTYQNVAALTYRLNQYIDRLALFEGDEVGAIVIRPADIDGRVLSLAVPKGAMTQAQRAAIEAARLRGQAFDIDLVVTPF